MAVTLLDIPGCEAMPKIKQKRSHYNSVVIQTKIRTCYVWNNSVQILSLGEIIALK